MVSCVRPEEDCNEAIAGFAVVGENWNPCGAASLSSYSSSTSTSSSNSSSSLLVPGNGRILLLGGSVPSEPSTGLILLRPPESRFTFRLNPDDFLSSSSGSWFSRSSVSLSISFCSFFFFCLLRIPVGTILPDVTGILPLVWPLDAVPVVALEAVPVTPREAVPVVPLDAVPVGALLPDPVNLDRTLDLDAVGGSVSFSSDSSDSEVNLDLVRLGTLLPLVPSSRVLNRFLPRGALPVFIGEAALVLRGSSGMLGGDPLNDVTLIG